MSTRMSQTAPRKPSRPRCQQVRSSSFGALVEVWQRLEGRMRVAILNGAGWQAPMMARNRHAPIVEAIKRGDVEAAVRVVDGHMTAAAQHFAEVTESA